MKKKNNVNKKDMTIVNNKFNRNAIITPMEFLNMCVSIATDEMQLENYGAARYQNHAFENS